MCPPHLGHQDPPKAGSGRGGSVGGVRFPGIIRVAAVDGGRRGGGAVRQAYACVSLLFSCSVMSDSFVTPWTAARQAPLSVGFSRHEYWRGLPFPSPRDLPNPGIELESPVLVGGFFTTVRSSCFLTSPFGLCPGRVHPTLPDAPFSMGFLPLGHVCLVDRLGVLACILFFNYRKVGGASGKESACQCRRLKRCRFDP